MDNKITMPDSLFLPNICSGGYLAQQGLHAQAIVHLLCPKIFNILSCFASNVSKCWKPTI